MASQPCASLEIFLERRLILKNPLPGENGPFTELTVRPVERRNLKGRPFGMDKTLWRLSRMTGLPPDVIAHLSEIDALALMEIMNEMAANFDAVIAAFDDREG